MFTFAVVAARPGRVMPSWVAEHLARSAPDDLPYTPVHHVTWSSADGRVLAAAWQDADRLGIGPRWDVRPRGFTAFGGMPWHEATPWTDDGPWAGQLADLFERRPLRALAPDLDGTFTVASVGVDGTGTVTADPLGLRALYRAEGPDVVVAGDRAAVVAHLAAPAGQAPARDPEGMAWLLLGGTLQEGRTGFADVRRVPDGSLLELTPHRPLAVVTWDERPWWSGPPVASERRAEVVAEIGEDLRALTRVLADLPSRCRRVNLSGGHDSRLVLALLLQEGLQHRCRYVSWGAPSHRDVEVAAQLAERYELDHTAPGQFRPFRRPAPRPGPCPPDELDELVDVRAGPRPDPGFVEAARHHCWTTAGGLSLWDRALASAPPADSVSLTGDLGELLRPRNPGAFGFATVDEAAAALRAGWLHLDPAGLLRRSWREDLLDRVGAQLRAGLGEGATPQDAADALYLRSRLRPWYGANAELDQRNAVTPFARLRAIRSAFALGAEARRQELVAFTLVRDADPGLAKHPFADRGWPPEVVAGLPDAAEHPTTPVAARWRPPRRGHPIAALRRRRRPAADPRATPVKDVARQAGFAEDLGHLRALIDQHASPAFLEVVDEKALRRALAAAEGGDTSKDLRRSLFDAATAAIWLDRGEAEVPGLSRR